MISISSLITRSDDEALAAKVPDVNKVLKEHCLQKNWGFVDHSNISASSHLNRSGIHLNKGGTSHLAWNFIRKVKHDVYGKRQTAKMKLLPSFFSSLYNRIKIFVFAVNSNRHVSVFV